MKGNFSWLTPKEAAQIIGCSTRHVQNLIVAGKLSASKEDGKYYIDKSEFYRVFPETHRKEEEVSVETKACEADRLNIENQFLKTMFDKKEKEVEFLRSQIENVSCEKSKMLEIIGSNARLLEHKQNKENEVHVSIKEKLKRLFKLKK